MQEEESNIRYPFWIQDANPNVNGYTEPICITIKDPQCCVVNQMYDKITTSCESASKLAREKWGLYLDSLEHRVKFP